MQKQIYNLISAHLQNLNIEFEDITVNDVSYKHADHYENAQESHYNIVVFSSQMAKMKTFERHKILNDATANLVRKDKIHAISFLVKENLSK